MFRRALVVLMAAALPGLAATAGAARVALPDSTWTERWTLKNGLDVTVRHVPDCDAVTAIVAWRVGRDQDPQERDGMADLLAELMLTARAGDVPERSREEMA